MIGRERFDKYLARRGLVEMKGAQVQEAFRVFKERTDGFLEIAWNKHACSPEGLKQSFEQFGFDCYTQGCIDGATTVHMRPELLEVMRSAEVEENK